jgi:regulatory protein
MRGAPSTPPKGTAKDRALRLLGVRWRSRQELWRRLRQAGFEPEEISAALDDLERAGLVEDARFARELVRDQARRRLAGNRVIRGALREKGVDPEIAEAALEEAGEEGERAAELAARRAARLRGLDPDAAYRRLLGLLLRRGFSHQLAAEAARGALREIVEDDLPPPVDGP